MKAVQNDTVVNSLMSYFEYMVHVSIIGCRMITTLLIWVFSRPWGALYGNFTSPSQAKAGIRWILRQLGWFRELIS